MVKQDRGLSSPFVEAGLPHFAAYVAAVQYSTPPNSTPLAQIGSHSERFPSRATRLIWWSYSPAFTIGLARVSLSSSMNAVQVARIHTCSVSRG